MPLTPINPANLGLLGIDCDPKIDKEQRGLAVIQFGEIMPEENPTEEDWQIRNPGDFENAFFWNHDFGASGIPPRGVVGAWSFAMPAFALRKQKVAGVVSGLQHKLGASPTPVSGTPYWRPLEQPRILDMDFVERDDVTEATFAYGGLKMPGRAEAILVATTGHGLRKLMAFHPGGPIVAQHEGPDQPQYSRHVFDIDADGNLDIVRHAGFHGPFHVRAWIDSYCQLKGMGPAPILPGHGTAVPIPRKLMQPPKNSSFAVLLNGSGAADSSGYLGTHFSDAEAVESKERGGPLWRSQKRHSHGQTADGFDVRGGAMWMDMLLNAGDDAHDAPWNWEKEFYVPAADGVHPYKVHFRINKDLTHEWCGETLPDRWDWEVFLPVMEWPPCNASREPVPGDENPKNTFPPTPPVGALTGAQFSGMIFQPRVGVLAGGPKPRPTYVRP